MSTIRRVGKGAQRRAHATKTVYAFACPDIGAPDHLHAIWSLPAGDADYAMRWNLIKGSFSRGLPASASRSESKIAKREKGLWQRRYWEHMIRDDTYLARHVDYVHINPVKHWLVSRTSAWPHSSFHRYVARGDLPQDWAGDVRDIMGLFGE